ncbi:hypothetical protein [Rathayibacter sp. VKM Ac-2927]|uniref:hypothetical protein n=1 Tax=Rathayibacter sp. VKM Ac-2927 TaxID=2929478 RepID=UPI001FB47B62|nr:hypothetical protein [Rathayibacter sp. VKM Ac-2927]MCJ1688545.1 hypothetical protein [Rathayibacter sp. VKM Ac-2927]
MQRKQAVLVLASLVLLGATVTGAGIALAAPHAVPSATPSMVTLPSDVEAMVVPGTLHSVESSASAETRSLEPGAPTAEGAPVESADAAIALALRDEASIKVATSTDAVRTTPEEAYGSEGLLAGFSPPSDGPSSDDLWLVGVTGEIRNSFGAIAVPLDWMIFVIDAKTGALVGRWGNTGTLPDIFD